MNPVPQPSARLSPEFPCTLCGQCRLDFASGPDGNVICRDCAFQLDGAGADSDGKGTARVCVFCGTPRPGDGSQVRMHLGVWGKGVCSRCITTAAQILRPRVMSPPAGQSRPSERATPESGCAAPAAAGTTTAAAPVGLAA